MFSRRSQKKPPQNCFAANFGKNPQQECENNVHNEENLDRNKEILLARYPV